METKPLDLKLESGEVVTCYLMTSKQEYSTSRMFVCESMHNGENYDIYSISGKYYYSRW